AWGDARWSGTEAHERDRHGRLGPRLLDGHVRQGWPGRAGRRCTAHASHSQGGSRRKAQVTQRLSNDEVIDRALAGLRSAGARTAEVFLREAQSGTVETKDGEIEVVIARGERGLGVRVLDGERMGFAHSSDLAAAGIEACVEQSRRMARITEPDADLRIASRALDVADLAIYHAGLQRRAPADRRARREARDGQAGGEAVRDAEATGRAGPVDGAESPRRYRAPLLRGQRAEGPEPLREQGREQGGERARHDRRRRASQGRPAQR